MIKYKNKLIIELIIRINMYLIMHLFILNIKLKININEHLIMELNIWMNCPHLFGKRKGECGGILTFEWARALFVTPKNEVAFDCVDIQVWE